MRHGLDAGEGKELELKGIACNIISMFHSSIIVYISFRCQTLPGSRRDGHVIFLHPSLVKNLRKRILALLYGFYNSFLRSLASLVMALMQSILHCGQNELLKM